MRRRFTATSAVNDDKTWSFAWWSRYTMRYYGLSIMKSWLHNRGKLKNKWDIALHP